MREGWEVKKLGEVSEIMNGGTPKTTVPNFWDGENLWITPKDMGKMESIYIDDTLRKITDEGLKNSSAKMLPVNSIILSSRAPIGHLAINKKSISTNQGCKGLVPKNGISTLYLYYFLSKSVELLNSLGTGATFKELSCSKLGTVEIPLPPLSEQKRIVAILDKAFAAIAKAKANAEQNLENAKELFESYLQGVFENKGEGWEEKTLGGLCELTRGHNPPKSKFINEPKDGYVRFYQIRDGWSDDYKVYVPDTPQLHRIEPSDILMVAYRHIGKVFRGVSGAFNVALCKISNIRRDLLEDDFLFYMIPTDVIKGELMKRSERSLIPSMSVNHLKEISIPLPPLKEQQTIVKKLDVLSAKTKKLEAIYQQKIDNLEELKKSVLQKAFNGEL